MACYCTALKFFIFYKVFARTLVNNRIYFLLLLTFNIALFLGCYKITTVFSHAQTVVLCVGCSTVLCQPTGGKARLTEGIHLAFSNPVLMFYYYKYLPFFFF